MSRDKALLQIILREIDILSAILKDKDKSTFLSSETIQRAVVMTLINIGEKVKDLTSEFKSTHPETPWKEISGIRDMAAHAYLKLNFYRIWETVQNDVPMLKKQISDIVKII